MSEYSIVNNYCVFEELNSDSVGINYRVGGIKDRNVEKHWLLTEVYPSISNNPAVWKRVAVLMEGIKKPNIPGLYCPEKIIEEGEKSLLIYPFIKGKSLETILEDVTRTNTPLEIELAFSIAVDIADVLETGSTIIINKTKSFHGVLTPDNIMINLDGKIFLKNYGVFPYLGKDQQFLTETRKKFNNMLAPEFIKDGQLTPQTDIYYIGNIIHRLLTGEYFYHSPEKDFESHLSDILLTEHILAADDDFSSNIIELFRKTLNPDPAKRFTSIKGFKDYISRYFHIEELSSATFIIAYFMNQLYMKTMEDDDKRLKEELSHTLPEERVKIESKKPIAREKIDDHVIEDILIELEQQKRSRKKIVIPLVLVIIIIMAVSGFIIINQQRQARKQQQAQLQREQELANAMAQMKTELKAEYERRLKFIEDRASSTEEEKKAREKEVEELKNWRQEQEKRTEEKLKTQLELKKQREAAKAKEREAKKQELAAKTQPPSKTTKETIREQKVESKPVEPEVKKEKQPEIKSAPNIVGRGDIVSIDSVTFTPSKLSGKRNYKATDLNLSANTLNKYAGQTLTIQSDILVDERGNVLDTKIKERFPGDLQAKLTEVLKTWTYIPAELDKTKVKVWIPVDFKVAFEGTPKAASPVPLDSVTYRPSKLKGDRDIRADELKLANSIMDRYAGQTLTVQSTVLIDESGDVTDVNIEGNVPDEIKVKAAENLKTWKFTAAEKDKTKVKVWMPVQLGIIFEAKSKPKPEPEKEPEIVIDESTIVPLDSVTYRPSKLRGNRKVTATELKLTRSTRNKYKGKSLTVRSEVLIGEHGNVLKVRVKGDFPRELKLGVAKTLQTWKFVPAEKNKEKVKVWFPVRLLITF
jgi:serine/threonine protein kinase